MKRPKREDWIDGGLGDLAYRLELDKYIDYQDQIIKSLTLPNKNEIRKRNKRKFIYDNLVLVTRCYDQGNVLKGHKSLLGVELIIKAREELTYSDLTYNGDIYYGIMKEFIELQKEAE